MGAYTLIKPKATLFLTGILAVFGTFALATIFTQHTSALSGADFNAGRIIDDSVFYNSNSMNATEIQQFLNSKVPVCDTNGTQWHSSGRTRAQHGIANGAPPPYVCLKDYSQHVPAVVNSGSDLCPGSITAGTKSAAQIIFDVSRACGVNPKVLIVLLQKEQSLITDDWPWPIQYRSATGYGCPDTAPCDAEFYGFFNQVYQAAKAYKRYRANPTNYNYRAGRNNTILWHPNAACGSSTVYIENQATAGLYIYTPYRPNQAALNNLYGTGDSCSSYGNRNFWRMFNDWFGTTHAPNFDWSLSSQMLYADNTKSSGSSGNLKAGDRAYAVIKIRNSGNQTWTKSGANTVRLGTIRPYERISSFCDPSWLSCSRPASMVENSVGPGEIATFEFWIKAPQNGGTFDEYFGPVAEGITWLRDIGLFYRLNVQPPTYTWQMLSQYAYTDETKTTHKNLATLLPGEKAYIGFTARNTGNMTWQKTGANFVSVGTLNPHERISAFSTGSNWLSATRATTFKEASVAPGQTATFEFWITAPHSGGVRHERFGLVVNGIAWMNDTGLSFYTNVQHPTYTWQLVNQYAYTDSSKTTPRNLATLRPGEKAYIGFTARNTGNMTWHNSGPYSVMVGTANPLERPSVFSPNSSWLSGTRPATMKEASVAPGQTATFEFWITAPNTPGERHERFSLIINGVTWMNDTGLSFYTKVTP